MFFRTLLCCLALLFCAALPAQKTKERVKNRAENRANNNVDRKVDRAVDDAFNAVGNLFKKKNRNKKNSEARTPNATADTEATQEAEDAARAGNIMGAFGLTNEEFEPYTNERSFSVVMESTRTKRNGKQEQNVMRVAMLPTQIALVMEHDGDNTRTLFDTQTGKTTLVSTDKKGNTEATRMRMPSFGRQNLEETAAETTDHYTFEETGETRTIDGFPCRKIIATDTKSGTVTEGWVTEAAGITHYEVFSGIASMFTGGGNSALRKQLPAPPVQGLMIEGTTTESNGARTTMKLSDIRTGEGQVDRSLFDLSGIPVQEVGN